MHDVWKSVVTEVKNSIVPFNDYIISDFRYETMSKIIDSIDAVFKACMEGFGDRVIYHGYQELTIPERIKYLSDSKYYKQGNIEINPSTGRLIKFQFEFDSQQFFTITEVPYLSADRVLFNGKEYYSLLTITEKGRYITKNGVKIKVMKCPMSFVRSTRGLFQFKTTDGNIHRQIIITAKIHQSNRNKTPLLCYILAYYKWEDALALFDMQDDVKVVIIPDEPEGYEYVKIRENMHLKYRTSIVNNTTKMRVIASLIKIYKFCRPTDITMTTSKWYHMIALGKFTNPSTTNNDVRLLYSNVVKLLKNCDTLLDAYVIQQLHRIGIHVNNLFELCVIIFKDIDKWIAEYNPCDLYNKKMNSLNNLLADFTEQVFRKQFEIISNRRRSMEAGSISSFSHAGSKSLGWYTNNKSFVYTQKTGDCSLFQLLKRVYTLDNLEAGNKKTATKYVPLEILKAHPSHLAVTSITNIPSSNPIITGTITPFTEVDELGNCIKRKIDKALDHVYDTP